MPLPRRHRHHYAGVFALHAKLRARDPPELDARFAFPLDQSPLINHPSALLLLPLGCFAVVANPPQSPQTPLPLHSVAKTRPLAPSP
jgi:hypothetical protein